MPYCILFTVYLTSDNFTSQGESAVTGAIHDLFLPKPLIPCHVFIFRNAILLLANFIIVSHTPIGHHMYFQCRTSCTQHLNINNIFMSAIEIFAVYIRMSF
jgi:hypothetical protein